jgi:ribosomal protein S18 acetylase RimI-like enzyme
VSAEKSWIIRQAEPSDVKDMVALRRESEQWLASRGIDQWTEKWQSVADEKAARATRQRRAWIVTSAAGATAGTVTLGGPDEDLWHPSDGPALYLYKLIVSRDFAGLGVGAVVLDWACTRAAEWGYPWLRLDAWPTNPQLLDYYRAHGFSDVRVEHVEGRDTGALMQRRAAAIVTPTLVDETA